MDAASLAPHVRADVSRLLKLGPTSAEETDALCEFVCDLALACGADAVDFRCRLLEADPDVDAAAAHALHTRIAAVLKALLRKRPAVVDAGAAAAAAAGAKKARVEEAADAERKSGGGGNNSAFLSFAAAVLEEGGGGGNGEAAGEECVDFSTPHLGCGSWRLRRRRAEVLPAYYEGVVREAEGGGRGGTALGEAAAGGSSKEIKEMLRRAADAAGRVKRELQAARRGGGFGGGGGGGGGGVGGGGGRRRGGQGRERPAGVASVQLPVERMAREVADAVCPVGACPSGQLRNRVVIIEGETGSGKTTKIPQILCAGGRARSVLVTQPRRVAAVSAAARVAAEMRCRVGHTVGYTVRHKDVTSRDTRIRYVTDGILCRELDWAVRKAAEEEEEEAASGGRGGGGAALLPYNVVVLDEVHERSLNTDFLFAVFKSFVLPEYYRGNGGGGGRRRRRLFPEDFTLVVTSATLDKEKLVSFFSGGAAASEPPPRLLTVPGRTYPVEEFYAQAAPADYVAEAVRTACDVCAGVAAGERANVLVFLTGQDDVEWAARLFERALRSEDVPQGVRERWRAVTLYGAQAMESQMRVFEDEDEDSGAGGAVRRRQQPRNAVIFSTNIAETSLTVPDVVVVVDCGLEKRKVADPVSGIETLELGCVSKKAAQQRKGRGGRTRAGVVYRLYTAEAFAAFRADPHPEVTRLDVTQFVLQAKSLRLNLTTSEMMDRPPARALCAALLTCRRLALLDAAGDVTSVGRRAAALPLPPPHAVALLGCPPRALPALATLLAVLSSQRRTVFRLGGGEDSGRHRLHDETFRDDSGDHMTLVNAYDAWARMDASASGAEAWCGQHMLDVATLQEVRRVRAQLERAARAALPQRHGAPPPPADKSVVRGDVLRCLVLGCFDRLAAAHLAGDGDAAESEHRPQQQQQQRRGRFVARGSIKYASLYNDSVLWVHPASALEPSAGKESTAPRWVVFDEVSHASKEWMLCVSKVSPRWVSQIHGDLYERCDIDGVALGYLQAREPRRTDEGP